MARVKYLTKEIPCLVLEWRIGYYEGIENRKEEVFITVFEDGLVGLSGKDFWRMLEPKEIVRLLDKFDDVKRGIDVERVEQSREILRDEFYLDEIEPMAFDWQLAQLLYEMSAIRELRDNGFVANISTEKFAVEYLEKLFNMNSEEFYKSLLEWTRLLFNRLREELKKRNIRYEVFERGTLINIPKIRVQKSEIAKAQNHR